VIGPPTPPASPNAVAGRSARRLSSQQIHPGSAASSAKAGRFVLKFRHPMARRASAPQRCDRRRWSRLAPAGASSNLPGGDCGSLARPAKVPRTTPSLAEETDAAWNTRAPCWSIAPASGWTGRKMMQPLEGKDLARSRPVPAGVRPVVALAWANRLPPEVRRAQLQLTSQQGGRTSLGGQARLAQKLRGRRWRLQVKGFERLAWPLRRAGDMARRWHLRASGPRLSCCGCGICKRPPRRGAHSA